MPGDVADFRPIRGLKIILYTQRNDILSGPALRAAPAKIRKFLDDFDFEKKYPAGFGPYVTHKTKLCLCS